MASAQGSEGSCEPEIADAAPGEDQGRIPLRGHAARVLQKAVAKVKKKNSQVAQQASASPLFRAGRPLKLTQRLQFLCPVAVVC